MIQILGILYIVTNLVVFYMFDKGSKEKPELYATVKESINNADPITLIFVLIAIPGCSRVLIGKD